MTDEPTYDEHEQAEAEALARALDGGRADAPSDAIEASEVVRMLKAPTLSDARATAVLAAAAQRIAAARRRSRVRIALLGTAASALAMAAAALLMVTRAPQEAAVAIAPAPVAVEAPAEPSLNPAAAGAARADGPVERLRRAQVAWLEAQSPPPNARAELAAALREYRDEQLSMLEARYVR